MKEKIHRFDPALWFNKLCQLNHRTPNCIKITVSGHNRRCYKAVYNICYTLELITQICICRVCILSCILKRSVVHLCIGSQTLVISRYIPAV